MQAFKYRLFHKESFFGDKDVDTFGALKETACR